MFFFVFFKGFLCFCLELLFPSGGMSLHIDVQRGNGTRFWRQPPFISVNSWVSTADFSQLKNSEIRLLSQVTANSETLTPSSDSCTLFYLTTDRSVCCEPLETLQCRVSVK